jgi:cellulose synthase/poly-beta-1,6-N-acetylglucosamine synthase-like glycosyltransferase
MEVVFWTFLILSVYPYLIYPGLVYLISKGLNRAWKRGDSISRVTLIISVYNEENVIEKKIGNALSLEYPEGLLEIIVVSDGSTDRTNEIVSGFKDPRLVFKIFPERSGKTACLNRVIPEAKGEIVVFTDANSMFPPDSVPKLVRNFLDNNVGLVTGWTKYTAGSTEEGTSGIYSRLEMKTKYWESLISSCVGADGAIFAIRKNLYRLLDDQDINDFVIPFHVLSQGKRVILDPDVYCFEEPSKGDREEYRRQARITNRTLRAILRNPGFLNPFSFGSFSLFLLSHKLLRFLVPFFITGAFFVNLLLIEISPIYISLFLIQILFFVLGLANLLGKVEGRLANFCKYFLITLLAQFTGWIRSIRGISDTMWTPKH